MANEASKFKAVTDALGGIVQAIAEPINRAKPSKATVKFGMELTVEAGQLTAVLVKSIVVKSSGKDLPIKAR